MRGLRLHRGAPHIPGPLVLLERQVTLSPTLDQILVRVLPADGGERTTSSGLVLPDTAAVSYQRGEVLAVGPGPRTPTGYGGMDPRIRPGAIVRWREKTGVAFRTERPGNAGPLRSPAPGREAHGTDGDAAGELKIVREESLLAVEVPE